MNIVVLTPVRLLGDGLDACFRGRPAMSVVAVLSDLASLRETLQMVLADVVLVDVTLGIDLFDVRAIAAEWPDVALVALGLNEQRQDVIQCGRLGFAGYVSRHASIDAVCKSLWEIVDGRLACPPEISGGLLRALFRKDTRTDDLESDRGADPARERGAGTARPRALKQGNRRRALRERRDRQASRPPRAREAEAAETRAGNAPRPRRALARPHIFLESTSTNSYVTTTF